MLDDQSWSFPGMSRFKFRVETAGNLFWKNFLWRPPSWQINFEIGTRQIGNHFSLNLVRGINSPPPPKKKHHFYPEKNPSALSSDSQRNASAFLNDDESMKSRACLPGMDRWPYPPCGWKQKWPVWGQTLGWMAFHHLQRSPKSQRWCSWGQIAT